MSYTSTISIHSLRVEGDKTSTSCAGGKYISIHSLRVEGDLINAMHLNTSKISIHSLRVEGDWYAFVRLFVSGLHFNPLPPCGGRPLFASIRVPHFVFQSTPSVWRETALPKHRERRRPISIHSLRVEGDQMFSFGSQPIKHFNPLPPCGGRPRYDIIILVTVSFQSTPSVWRETDRYRLCRAWQMISIHSLRVEGDMMYIHPVEYQGISIHSLRVEGDGCFFHILCSRQ